MLNPARRVRASGVSLVESLVVLAVSAVLLATGVPSLGGWVRDLEVRSSAGALLTALQAARAEAIARNAGVRLVLSDAQGRAGWTLACVQVSVHCPATIRRQPVAQQGGIRWAASSLAGMPPFGTALVAGEGMPASVSFDAVGSAPAIANGNEVARIDVIHIDGEPARRLVVQVSAHGMARICDPVATREPRQCR